MNEEEMSKNPFLAKPSSRLEKSEQETFPEQEYADGIANLVSKKYVKLPAFRAVVSCLPFVGGGADVLLTHRAAVLFENDVLNQFRKVFRELDSLEKRVLGVENFLQKVGLPPNADLISVDRNLKRLNEVYVAPIEWDRFVDCIRTHGKLIIIGPPHIGKSSTGLKLAFRMKSELHRDAVIHLNTGDDLRVWEKIKNVVLLLDDSFGSIQFNAFERADDFSRWLRSVSVDNTVICVSRHQVLNQAFAASKLGEDSSFASYIGELKPEISYGDSQLLKILEKHLRYSLLKAPESERINEVQSSWATAQRIEIVSRLRFPHNIDRFCSAHLPNVQDQEGLELAIDLAREIERATCLWVEERPKVDRWFILLLALFPPLPRQLFDDVFRAAAKKLNFPVEDLNRLSMRNGSYVTHGNELSLSHPSYVEALREHLQSYYPSDVGLFVDIALLEILKNDIKLLCGCDAADYGWPRPSPSGEVPGAFDIQNYLHQFSIAYRCIRDNAFKNTRSIISPYHDGEATPLFLAVENSGFGQLMILPTDSATPEYFAAMAPDDRARESQIDYLFSKAEESGVPFLSQSLDVKDLARRSPIIHALKWIRDDTRDAFNSQLFRPTPEMAHLYLEMALTKIQKSNKSYGISRHYERELPSDPANNFGQDEFNNLIRVWKECVDGGVPSNWKTYPGQEEAWKRLIAKDAGAIEVAMESLNYLLSNGHSYNGLLFQGRDRPGPEFGWRNYPYSAQAMEVRLEQALLFIDKAYRELAAENFPSLLPFFRSYREGPLRVVGAVSYSAFHHSSINTFVFLPQNFKTANGKQFELYVFCDESPVPSHEPKAFPTEVQERLSEVQKENYLWYQSGGLSDFLQPEMNIASVYRRLKEDLHLALGWEGIGKSRWRQMSQVDVTEIDGSPDQPPTIRAYDLTRKSGIWEQIGWKGLLNM